jgi:hypothetical protein
MTHFPVPAGQRLFPRLVVVHGLKESGKSTLADHLCDRYGYTRVKMAGPLKNMLRSLMRDAGVPDELIEGYVEGDAKNVPIPQLSNRTSRQLMQTLGDEWRRMQSEDFWIDIAVSKIDQLHRQGGRVVIDDVRYFNEFHRFAIYRPLTIVVTRGTAHFEPIEETRHPGERGLPIGMFQAHIANDFAEKQPYWDVADRVMETRADMDERLAALAVNPDPRVRPALAA